MDCWFCRHKLIWQCDYDYEDYGIEDKKGIVTILICPYCNSYFEGYYDIENEDSNE